VIDGCFRINAPDVINETIENEAIILHLGTGRYYSARGCGAQAWSWLSEAVPASRVLELLTATYDVSPEVASADLDAFVADLRAEGLLTETAAEASSVPESRDGNRLPYEAPSIECYTDLQDLLLLDPVHEVDASQGWPHVASDTSSV
jgi:hypothetical protein